MTFNPLAASSAIESFFLINSDNKSALDIGAQTPSQGGNKISNQLACLWVLNYSDGKHSLYEIAELSGYDIKQLENISNVLIDVGLLKEMKKNA